MDNQMSIEDRGMTNVVGDRMHIMTDMSRMACSSNAIVESNGDGWRNEWLANALSPPILAHLETFSQVGGITFELSIQHNWRQMGEQNMRNLGIVNDEEEYIESAYSRNNWDPKLEVGKIFSSKKALSNKSQLAALRGHFEFKVKQSCKSRLVVVCSQGPCPWRLRASSYGEKNFMIVKYNPDYTSGLELTWMDVDTITSVARMPPVVYLIDEIINLLVKWFSKRRDFALKCTSTLCPDFGEKKLRRRLECASRMNVVKLNHVEYNVVDDDIDGHVHLTNKLAVVGSFSLSNYLPQEVWVIPEDFQSRVVHPPNAKVMPG
ncbi:homolog of X-ray repair cross complementing 3 [Prunus dulcis]|uniref:Homolog of X-ray repair cross complementing 3 n=1 Tax=Prunus dulcis TaxID=3755 RepID=A0A5H2Y9Y2_PRUDU|nr:homolog of X-ray repair cross complementing 3 [Prunus dulcis]